MDTYPEVPRVSLDTCRALVQDGDYLLCSGTSNMSQMIRFATNSVWSHVGLLRRDDVIGRVLVYESVESVGVRDISLAHYATNYNHTGYPYPGRMFILRDPTFATVSPEDRVRFWQVATDLKGTEYDTKMVLAIARRIVACKLGMPSTPMAQDNLFICSEYGEHCGRTIGLVVPYGDAGFIAPCDFVTPPRELLWEIDTARMAA